MAAQNPPDVEFHLQPRSKEADNSDSVKKGYDSFEQEIQITIDKLYIKNNNRTAMFYNDKRDKHCGRSTRDSIHVYKTVHKSVYA